MAAFLALVGSALSLDRSGLAAAATSPVALSTALAVAFLGGTSLMLGQSVVLFANRVSRRRFVVCLFVGALVYVVGLVAWGITIWLVARFGFRLDPPTGAITFAVCAGQAPLLLGFFILIPYIGSWTQRVLDAYSLVVVVAALSATLGLRVWQAALLAGAGWALHAGLERLLSRPLSGVRTWLWRASTGRPTPIRRQDVSATLKSAARREALREGESSAG